MQTVAIISQKGGSGRTTLSVHLAVQADMNGVPVAILDTDPQATASLWSQWRGPDSRPDVLDCSAPLIASKVAALRKQGADLVIIDTPPHADNIAVAAATIADLVLIPVRVRAFDLAAAQTTIALTTRLGKPTYAVFMAGPANGTQIYKDAEEVLGIPVAPIRLPERADFYSGASDGRAAQDVDPDGKAAQEVAALFYWIRTLNGDAR